MEVTPLDFPSQPDHGFGHPRRRRRLWFRCAVVVLTALVAGGGLWLTLRSQILDQVAADVLGKALGILLQQPNRPSLAALRPQDPVTMLIMGTEQSPQFGGQQTDLMMVWSLDPTTRRMTIVSVPRDLWVNIPGYGHQRIDSAYEFGGYKTAELTVEKYIGVPVEYYAVVDYAGFVKLVNDVGGIDVRVPYNINDSCYPNLRENHCTVFRLSKGEHHLNGAQALEFARERHSLPLADLSREADQQLVLFALKDALLKPGSLLHLPRIMADMEKSVTTNLPYGDLPRLMADALRRPKSSVTHIVLQYANGAVSNFITAGGAYVLLPHEAAIHRLVASAFAPVLAHVRKATIQVEGAVPAQVPSAAYFSRVLDGMGARTLAPPPTAQTNNPDPKTRVFWNTAVRGTAAQPPTLAYMLAQMLETKLAAGPLPSSRAQIVVTLGKGFPRVRS